MRIKLIVAVLVGPMVVMASDSAQQQLYEIRTQTVMPHLEENLRYTATREAQCLSAVQVLTAFAVLRHPALADCRLEPDAGGSLSYALVCDNATGTTGRASWSAGERQLRGILEVKLGGKNMTFEQRVTARVLGPCDSSEFDRKSRSARRSDDH